MRWRCPHCTIEIEIEAAAVPKTSDGKYIAECESCNGLSMIELRKPAMAVTIGPDGAAHYSMAPPPFKPDLKGLLEEYEKSSKIKSSVAPVLPAPPQFLVRQKEEVTNFTRRVSQSFSKPPTPNPFSQKIITWSVFALSFIAFLSGIYLLVEGKRRLEESRRKEVMTRLLSIREPSKEEQEMFQKSSPSSAPRDSRSSSGSLK